MHFYVVRQSRNCKSRRGHRTRLRDCEIIFLYRRNLVLREATHNFKMHISIRTRKIYLTNITSYDKRNIDLIKNAFFFNFADNELYFFFIYIFKSWIYPPKRVCSLFFREKRFKNSFLSVLWRWNYIDTYKNEKVIACCRSGVWAENRVEADFPASVSP